MNQLTDLFHFKFVFLTIKLGLFGFDYSIIWI